jgi:hypothetical protein
MASYDDPMEIRFRPDGSAQAAADHVPPGRA